MKPWLMQTSDGKFPIEKVVCPDAGVINANRPAAGVLHTTEGGSWAGLVAEFKKNDAPNFLVGPHRIAQLVQLGRAGRALENAPGGVETNRWARAQIEVIGHSQDHPYSFDAATSDTLSSLLATLKVEAGIPLFRPYPDAMPPKPWATEAFSRRHDGKWGNTPAWFGHVEIPENSHWDPGALKWASLLSASRAKLIKAPQDERPFTIALQDSLGNTTILQAKKQCVLTVDGHDHHLFKDGIEAFEGKRV